MLGACARTTQRLACDANFSTGSQVEAGDPSSGFGHPVHAAGRGSFLLPATLHTLDPVFVNPKGPPATPGAIAPR